jgi:GNAT superfamily N-acetyltransferase
MGVRADHRRTGIGRALMERLFEVLATRAGVRYVFVQTLGPSVPDDIEDGYQGTRAFYAAVGFTPLREFELRSWDDGATLVLVRALPTV